MQHPLTYEDFIERLKADGFGFCEISDSYGNRVTASNLGENVDNAKALEPTQLASLMKSKIDGLPSGVYSAKCKTSPSAKAESAYILKFQKISPQQQQTTLAAPPAPAVDVKAAVAEAIAAERAKWNLEDENRRLREEIERLKNQPSESGFSEQLAGAGAALGIGLLSLVNPELASKLQGAFFADDSESAPSQSQETTFKRPTE